MGDTMMVDELENQERTGRAQGGLSFDQFSRFGEEIRNEPLWRQEADKCSDYYDGNQLPREVLNELDSRGMGPLITNLIAPTVNTVLGMEAKTRSDWKVLSDDDASQDVAEALNVKLHEAERETRADRACSDAYASEIKAGMGWVEVSRHSDPFKSTPYRVSSIHRREMWWQWTAREPDLDDSNYLIRRRWFDKDAVKAYFPKYADLIEAAGGSWPSFWMERIPASPELMQAFDQERGWAWEDYEWRDTARSRVCLFECLYRTVVRGYVIKLPNRTVELDMKNPVHIAAVGNGYVKPMPAIFRRLSRSLWLGPHKLADKPHTSHRLPYVPFWGYREDLTGAPYGIIRVMISPQDEINARRQKLLWLLSAKRLTIDSDALDTKLNSLADVLAELNRADAAIVTNPNRKNADAVRVETHGDMTKQQFEVMTESKEALRQAAGVYQPFFDQASNAESGVAVQNLMDMGSTTLAEINDNYRFGRRMVGELLLEEIRDDMVGQQVQVMVGESPKKKTIFLNRPVQHESGIQMLENDTERTPVKVAMDDVPSTPTYRQQQFKMLSEAMKGLPLELQALIAPFWMEASDMPKRREVATLLRKAVGIADDGEQQQITPEQVDMMIQQAVEQALQQSGAAQKDKELEIKGRELELKAADQEHRQAVEAHKAESESLTTESKIEQTDAQTTAIRDKNDREAVQLALTLAQQVQQVGQEVAGMKEAVTAQQKGGQDNSAMLAVQLKEMTKVMDRLQRQVDQATRDNKSPDPMVKQMATRMDMLQRELLQMARESAKRTPAEKPEKPEKAEPIVLEQKPVTKIITIIGPGGKEYTGKITTAQGASK